MEPHSRASHSRLGSHQGSHSVDLFGEAEIQQSEACVTSWQNRGSRVHIISASAWTLQHLSLLLFLKHVVRMICVPQKILYDETPTSYMPGSGSCFRISRVSTIKKRHFCPKITPGSFFSLFLGDWKCSVYLQIMLQFYPLMVFEGDWRRISLRPNLDTLMS